MFLGPATACLSPVGGELRAENRVRKAGEPACWLTLAARLRASRAPRAAGRGGYCLLFVGDLSVGLAASFLASTPLCPREDKA